MILWNKVTWYSQLLAIVLGLVIFTIGFKLGGLHDQSDELVSYEVPSPVTYDNKAMTVTATTAISDLHTLVMPIEVGTTWLYEGNRTFYDRDEQKVREAWARKEVIIQNVSSEGGKILVEGVEKYKNDPDFTEKPFSFLLSENGFAFDGTNITSLPLEIRQRLSFESPERNDKMYDYYVTNVSEKEYFGEEYECYEITYQTLSGKGIEIFCAGLGYVTDHYTHNGTPNESNYNLVSIFP